MKKSEVDNFMLTVNSTSDYNGECFFQEYYSDVIYKVTSDVDIPYLTIDIGKYALPLEYLRMSQIRVDLKLQLMV